MTLAHSVSHGQCPLLCRFVSLFDFSEMGFIGKICFIFFIGQFIGKIDLLVDRAAMDDQLQNPHNHWKGGAALICLRLSCLICWVAIFGVKYLKYLNCNVWYEYWKYLKYLNCNIWCEIFPRSGIIKSLPIWLIPSESHFFTLESHFCWKKLGLFHFNLPQIKHFTKAKLRTPLLLKILHQWNYFKTISPNACMWPVELVIKKFNLVKLLTLQNWGPRST